MKQASRSYKDMMRRLLRNRIYAVASFGNIDITASTDGKWSGTTGVTWSKTDTLDYDYAYGPTAVVLDRNRWVLDGSQIIIPESYDGDRSYQDGWISSTVSSSTGAVNSILKKTFTIPHTLVGVTLGFGVDHPKKVTVRYTDLNGEITTFTRDNLDSDTEEFVFPGTDIMSVELLFPEVLPKSRARVRSVVWGIGKTYSNNELVSAKQMHDVDPLSRRLPSETLEFNILDYDHEYDPDNPSGIYAYINTGAPLSIQYGGELEDGTIEWLKPDKYSLQDRPVFKKNQVTFHGVGLIGSLSGIYYKGTLAHKSFYDLAEEVLLDADLTLTPEGGHPWVIDPALKTIYTDAALPIDTHMNLLQLIAHATGSRLYTDDDNIIHIVPFGVTPAGIFAGEFRDNGHMPWSEWESVEYGDDKEYTYATLEINRWVLGSKQKILEDVPEKQGYISARQAWIHGGATGERLSIWQRIFEVPHDLPLVEIVFDDVLEEYPSAIQITYYDASASVIGTYTYHPDNYRYVIDTSSIVGCKHFTINSLSTLPFYRMRVSYVAYHETDFNLSFASIKQNTNSTTVIEKLRDVKVYQYVYAPSNSSEYASSTPISSMPATGPAHQRTELYKGVFSGTSLHVEYQLATDITVTVSGGSLTDSKIYAQAADLTFTSGEKAILIEGVTLESTTITHVLNVNTTGADDEEDNPLITDASVAEALCNHVKEYLVLRNTYDADYRGNPELEAGDIIGLQTAYTNILYGIVLTDEIDFNGGLSGKLKVKGL